MAVQDDPALDRQQTPSSTVPAGVLVALAHLALVAVRPSPTAVELAGFELLVFGGVVALVAGTARRARLRSIAVATAVFVALVGGSWLALTGLALHWVAIALAALTALLSYGLHRYQLLALDVLEGSDEF